MAIESHFMNDLQTLQNENVSSNSLLLILNFLTIKNVKKASSKSLTRMQKLGLGFQALSIVKTLITKKKLMK